MVSLSAVLVGNLDYATRKKRPQIGCPAVARNVRSSLGYVLRQMESRLVSRFLLSRGRAGVRFSERSTLVGNWKR